MKKILRLCLALVAVPLAAMSLVLALLIRHYDDQCSENIVGQFIFLFWVFCPPVCFFAEWWLLRSEENKDDMKHAQDLARNIWLALVVVLATILKINPLTAG